MRKILLAVALFLVLFIALRHLRPQGILFYQGIGLAALVAFCQFALDWKQGRVPRAQALKDSMLSFLLIYCFVFTIPTTVDRAYSVKMLMRMGEAPAGMSKEDVAQMFVNGFLQEGAVDKRLKEQAATGSIEERDGRYSLTATGRFLDRAFRLTQAVFACEEKR
jgi:hypothetical protein